MSIESVQATNLTPCSRALSKSSSSDMPPASFVTFLIIGAPAPAKFILESPSFLVPLGIMRPNMDCRVLFLLPPLDATFSVLRRMLSPQKVQKMVTSSPIAAAPLAMMSAAITRSKSPLNRMIVFLVVSIRTPLAGLSDRRNSLRRRLP